MGKTIAEQVINSEIAQQNNLENEMVNNMKKDYQEPTDIMVKQFHELNKNINSEISQESKKFVKKMDIIKEVEKRELENNRENGEKKKRRIQLIYLVFLKI